MKIAKEWLNDLPQQFKDKEKIEVLINAFSKQLEDVEKAFEDIDSKCYIDTAFGKTLDNIGSILCMTRRDANVILRKAKDTEMTDDVYRKVLQYAALKNSSECTYESIMKSISLLMNTDSITYIENEEPATIRLKIDDVPLDGLDPAVGRVLAIKPAGVNVFYNSSFYAAVKNRERVAVNLINFPIKAYYYPAFRLDGSWKLDGTILLQGEKKDVATRVVIPIESKQTETFIVNI